MQNQEIFSDHAARYNHKPASKWPAALFCIQNMALGVCVHQWEGGEISESDGEGEDMKERKACT